MRFEGNLRPGTTNAASASSNQRREASRSSYTSLSQAHLWVFDGQRALLHVVEPDAAAVAAIRAAWDAFALFLDTDTPPPLSDADARQRDDESWHLAAVAFVSAKREAEAASGRLEAAREALVALATHPKEAISPRQHRGP